MLATRIDRTMQIGGQMPDFMDRPVLKRRELLIVRLMQAAYGYGSSLSRLEAALPLLAKGLGVNADMMATGKAGQFVFWEGGIESQRGYVVRLPDPSPELAKMVDIGKLMEDIAAGSVPADEGMRLLEEIESRPSRFGLVALAAALGLVGVGVAVMFSTQWIDVGLGFLAGVLAFTMILTGMRWSWLGRSLDFSTGLVTSFLATWLATAITGSNPFVITMCAVAVYIPGFLLSQGLTEMFMGNPLSGIGRIVGATMVTVRLFAGALIGTALAYLIWGEPPAPESIDVPRVVLFGFIGVLMVGVAVFFQARVADFWWVVLCGLVTYAALTLGNQEGLWQGALLGGLALGLFSNIWARLRRLPSTVVKLPGIMVLMPGVVAYIGIFDAAAGGTEALGAATTEILQTVFSLSVGIIVANLVVRPWVPPESAGPNEPDRTA